MNMEERINSTEDKRPIMIGKDKPRVLAQNPPAQKTEEKNLPVEKSTSPVKRTESSPGKLPRIPVISFSFIFSIVFLNVIIFLGIFAGVSFFSIKNHVIKMQEIYYQRGKELNLALASLSSESIKKGNYAELNVLFSKLANKQDAIKRENPISEILLLDKKGVVWAHSNMSKVTSNARIASDKISTFYNQDFFHEAILFEPGNVLMKDYHFYKEEIRDKFSLFLEFLLTEKLSYSTDFTSVLSREGMNIATLHVIMNKMYIYNYLRNWVFDSVYVLAGVMGASLLFSMLTLLLFYMKASSTRKILLAASGAGTGEVTINTSGLESSIRQMMEKISALPQRMDNARAPSEQSRPSGPVLDAILVEEDGK